MNADRYGVRGNAPESSVTYADLNREDAARDRRTDDVSDMPAMEREPGKYRPLTREELRANHRRDGDYLAKCNLAASLTAHDGISRDDREDVAATLATRYLDDAGRPTDITLSHLCGDARNIYRKVDTRRRHEADAARETAAALAATPSGLGIDPERAEIEAISAADAAELASTMAKRLQIKGAAITDSAVWSALYVWLRHADHLGTADNASQTETHLAKCASERDTTATALQRQCARGSQVIRGTYTVGQLIGTLLGGIGMADHHKASLTASRQLVDVSRLIYGGDGSRCADHAGTTMKRDERTRTTEPTEVDASAPVGPIDGLADLPPLRPRMQRTGTPEQRREAHRWNRAEYRARMASLGQDTYEQAGARATTDKTDLTETERAA